jgi:hypothetical protein
MPNLLPLRDYSEHKVVPFFGFSGALPVNAGTFVKIVGSGFAGQDLTTIGDAGNAFAGTYSKRWGVQPQVATIASTGDYVYGMLLYNGREVDENGEQLKFRPRKAAEMNVWISGQAAPIVREGTFRYSGIASNPTGGAPAYSDGAGGLVTSGPSIAKVGTFLGPKDTNGWAYVSIDLN